MKKLTLLLFVVILLTACGPTPQSVANSWQEALNKGDIDAALSYLAEDAVVTISPAGPEGDAVFTGHAGIRGWYETLTSAKGITTLSNCKVDGETITCKDVYSDEGLKAMGVDFLEGEWVATIKDGKIQAYTFVTSPASLAKLAPPPTEPPTVALTEPPLQPSPAVFISSEVPISSLEDVIGIWRFRFAGEEYLMEFQADGFFRVGWEGNPTGVAQAKYTVEEGLLSFMAVGGGSAEATYEVYVTKQDGKPALLRFVLVGEDPDADRKESLDGKTLKPYVP